MNRLLTGSIMAVALLFSGATVQAEEAPILRDGVSACDLHELMSEKLPEQCQSKLGGTRSMSKATRSLTRSVNLMVLFEHDSAELGEGARELLDAVGAFLADGVNTDQKFQIVGHTNSLGTDSYNQGLSQRRATAVVSYLTGKSVSVERLESEGKGETSPLGAYATDDPRQRRVELKKL